MSYVGTRECLARVSYNLESIIYSCGNGWALTLVKECRRISMPIQVTLSVEHGRVCLLCFSYLPLDSVTDSVTDSVIDLVYYPFFSHVYIEALVPYKIDRVLILYCRVRQFFSISNK